MKILSTFEAFKQTFPEKPHLKTAICFRVPQRYESFSNLQSEKDSSSVESDRNIAELSNSQSRKIRRGIGLAHCVQKFEPEEFSFFASVQKPSNSGNRPFRYSVIPNNRTHFQNKTVCGSFQSALGSFRTEFTKNSRNRSIEFRPDPSYQKSAFAFLISSAKSPSSEFRDILMEVNIGEYTTWL